MSLLLVWCLFASDLDALAADDLAAREAAEARLQRWAWAARPALDWPFRDPERRRRAARVLARHDGRLSLPGGRWPVIGALSPQAWVREWDGRGEPAVFGARLTWTGGWGETVANYQIGRLDGEEWYCDAETHRRATFRLFAHLKWAPLWARQHFLDWMVSEEARRFTRTGEGEGEP